MHVCMPECMYIGHVHTHAFGGQKGHLMPGTKVIGDYGTAGQCWN